MTMRSKQPSKNEGVISTRDFKRSPVVPIKLPHIIRPDYYEPRLMSLADFEFPGNPISRGSHQKVYECKGPNGKRYYIKAITHNLKKPLSQEERRFLSLKEVATTMLVRNVNRKGQITPMVCIARADNGDDYVVRETVPNRGTVSDIAKRLGLDSDSSIFYNKRGYTFAQYKSENGKETDIPLQFRTLLKLGLYLVGYYDVNNLYDNLYLSICHDLHYGQSYAIPGIFDLTNGFMLRHFDKTVEEEADSVAFSFEHPIAESLGLSNTDDECRWYVKLAALAHINATPASYFSHIFEWFHAYCPKRFSHEVHDIEDTFTRKRAVFQLAERKLRKKWGAYDYKAA